MGRDEKCSYAKCRTQENCAGCDRNAMSATETTWKLRTITDDIECTLDNSGIYCTINRIVDNQHSKGYIGQAVSVRVDIMGIDDAADRDEPVMSFVGKADNVRKAVMRYLTSRQNGRTWTISGEHASYIGSEIARAELNEHYVQS